MLEGDAFTTFDATAPAGDRWGGEGEAMSIPAVGERRLAPPVAEAPSHETRPPSSPDSPSPFARLVRGIGHEVERSEALVHQAIASARGGQLSPSELIALQDGVYRYSETVDLASRLVDHATSALKTVLQGQQ
jgi:hypothetical protein